MSSKYEYISPLVASPCSSPPSPSATNIECRAAAVLPCCFFNDDYILLSDANFVGDARNPAFARGRLYLGIQDAGRAQTSSREGRRVHCPRPPAGQCARTDGETDKREGARNLLVYRLGCVWYTENMTFAPKIVLPGRMMR